MQETWDFEKCVSVLTGEIELLRKISAAQNRVRQAVMNREWTDFDEKTMEIENMGREFSKLENEREKVILALGGSETAMEKPFYEMISGLPAGESRELARLYRELKMETLKMKTMNETFMVYLNEAKTMTAAYLEAVCPARGGKLYTRKGHRVSQDLKSIVFNNRF